MSQPNRKYKRLEALLSENRPAQPDPVQPSANDEVVELKAQVAELQAKLEGQQYDPLKVSASLIPSITSQGKPASPITEEHDGILRPVLSDVETSVNTHKEGQKAKGFIRNLLLAPVFEDLAKQRLASLQYKILTALLITNVLAIIALFAAWNGTQSLYGLVVLVFEFALFILASFWLHRGYLERVSWVFVGVIYGVFITTLPLSGFGFSSILELALVISLAGLLLKPTRVVGVTIFMILTLLALPYISSTQIPQTEIFFVFLILGLEGLLLAVASSTLEQSFVEVDRSTKALVNTNKELQDLSLNLEKRVQDRTHDLDLASKVGQSITERVGNLSELLSQSVELIRSYFDLYYTQVYLVDPSGRAITLRAGTGDIGQQLLQRGHHLSINSSSLNGRAASEKKPVIVADTEKSTSFLPNPLLPKTRSEIAIPLLIGDKILGVLDMQSEFPNALNENSIASFQILAGQLSVALQNASLLAQSEEARKQVEESARQATSIGWMDFLNGTDRGEKIGYTFDQTELKPLEYDSKAQSNNTLNVPITIIGAAVGTIQVAQDERDWTSNEEQIIKATAGQLAQHIENLRLLSQAEKYRQEAEQVTRRLTREGWDAFQEQVKDTELGFIYDGNKVESLSNQENDLFEHAQTYEIKIHGESIGQFGIATMSELSDENQELVESVSEQLSAHIENLRLSLQTEQALATTQKLAGREYALRQITSALRSSTDPATIMRTAVRELGSVLGRATVVQMVTSERGDPLETTVTNRKKSNSPDGLPNSAQQEVTNENAK